MIGIGFLIIVGFLATSAFLMWSFRAQEINEARKHLSNLSQVLAEQTTNALLPADWFLRDAIATLRQQRQAPRPDDGRLLHGRLEEQASSLEHVLSIFVVDAAGAVTISSRSYPSPKIDASDRSYFKAHRDNANLGLFISEPRRNHGDPTKWSFFLSHRFSGEDDGPEQVVVASVDLDYFETLYRDIHLAEGSTVMLRRRDGMVLAKYPHDDAEIGKSLVDIPRQDPLGAALARSWKESGGEIVEALTVDGVEWITGSRSIGGYPLVVSVAIPLEVALADWREEAVAMGLGSLLAAAMVAALLVLLFRQSIARERAAEALRTSEERYAIVARGTTDGIWDWNIATGEDYFSSRWLELVGFDRGDKFSERSDFEKLLHPNDRDRVLEAVRRHLDEREPYDIEYRLRTKGGEYRWFLGRGQAIWDEDGTPLRMAGSISDITERKIAEAALRESEEKLNAFFNNAPVGMAMYDRDMRYTKINKQLAWRSGLSVDEHLGKTLTEIKPNVATILEKAYRRVFDTGKAVMNVEVEGEIRLGSGVKSWWWGTAFPATWADGEPTNIGVLAVDVTERKRAEERIRTLNAELEKRVEERTSELRSTQQELVKKEKMATLGQLSATVSHELRNPLGTIQTSVAVIDQKVRGTGAGVERAIDRIKRNVSRCDKIIDEMLDFARIRDVALEPTPADSWLAGLLDDLDVPEGVEVRREFSAPDARPSIDGDRLRRAVINIYENACHSMAGEQAGGGGKILSVATRVADGRLEISISDTGGGMSADVLVNAFEPLYSTKGFGVGLGLPTVKQIMAAHSGGVEIETEEGRGTRVVLWLPMKPSPGALG